MRRLRELGLSLCLLWIVGGSGFAQSLPTTAGETLSGKPVLLAEAVHGRSAVLVVGFSKDAADGCGAWAKALRADAGMVGVPVFQVAMLGQAPGFVRGMIKGAMRKGLSASELDNFVVLTQEEKLWRSYFGVTAEKEPYVVLLEASGAVKWRGHGAAKGLEPLLRAALK